MTGSLAAEAEASALAFAHAQSYGKSVPSDVGPVPRRARLRGGGTPRLLPRGLTGLLAHREYLGAAPESRAPTLEALEAVLVGALAPLRHEPLNAYNPHRPYPSARSVFAVEAWLLAPGPPSYLDANRRMLIPVTPPPRIDTATDGAGAAVIALVARVGAFPAGYGDLRYALALLEAGHAAETVLEVAGSLGLDPSLQLDFPDAAVLAAVGVDDDVDVDAAWVPAALVSFGGPADLDLPELERPATCLGVLAVDRAGWSDGTDPAPWERASARPAPRPVDGAVGDRPDLRSVLFDRSAGRGSWGLSPAPEPVASWLLADVAAVAQATAATAGVSIRLLVASDRVLDGHAGLQALHVDGSWEPVVLGPVLHRVQAAFAYPAASINVAAHAAVFFLVVDYGAEVARLGPRAVRVVQIELGRVAQALSLALASHGLLARPARSYDERGLDDLLALKPRESVGYLVLAGRDRVPYQEVDLRD